MCSWQWLTVRVPLCLAGPLVESPPAAAPATEITPVISVASQDASSLVNLLSKVDVIPSDLLGALSKVQGQSSFAGETKESSVFSFKTNILYHVCILSSTIKAACLKWISSFFLSSLRHLLDSEQPSCKCLLSVLQYRQDSSFVHSCISSSLSEPVSLLCWTRAFNTQLFCKTKHNLPSPPPDF